MKILETPSAISYHSLQTLNHKDLYINILNGGNFNASYMCNCVCILKPISIIEISVLEVIAYHGRTS